MINFTDKIIFLKTGQELSDCCHKALEDTCSHLRKCNNFSGDAESIKTKDYKNGFIKFFSAERLEGLDLITESQILKLYELTTFSWTRPPTTEEIQNLSLYQPNSKREAPTSSYHRGIKRGLLLAFIHLWKQKAILLPYSFELPDHTFYSNEEKSNYSSSSFTFFRGLHQNYGGAESSFFGKYKINTRDLNALSGYWCRLILTTTWYELSEITANELAEVKEKLLQVKTNYFTSSLRIMFVARMLFNEVSDQLSFEKKDLIEETAEFHLKRLPESANKSKIRIHNSTISKEFNQLFGEDIASPYGTEHFKKYQIDNKTTKYSVVGGVKRKVQPDHLSDLLSIIYDTPDSITEEDLLIKIHDLTIKELGKRTFINTYQKFAQPEHLEAATYWYEIFAVWLKKKAYENSDHADGAIGFLSAYLFIYLPWWYCKNKDLKKLPQFPNTANNLNGVIFIAGLLDRLEGLPMTYLDFMEETTKIRSWSRPTQYGYMSPIVILFRWLQQNRNRLKAADTFETPLLSDDLPSNVGYGQSQKKPLPRSLFKLFIRYCYALLEFQKKLMERVEEGLLDPNYLGAVGAFIKLKDHVDPELENRIIEYRMHDNSERRSQPVRELDLTKYHLDRPIVSNEDGEEDYPIQSIFRFFYHNEYFISETEEKELIYPGDLHVCILMLETGIRANHLRWLNNNTFDIKVDYQVDEHYLHPLLVNTDKVRKKPWVATVASRVIKICNEQKIWRNKIHNESFTKDVFYNGSKTSKFGAFKPLFSYTPKSGTPSSGYENTWLYLICGFQEFLIDNKIPHAQPLINIKPIKHKYYEDIDPGKVIVKEGGVGDFCPITYAKHSTPHSARNSVVSDRCKYLPEYLVGKHITGQHERLVFYYNLRDTEDHYADQALQWMGQKERPVIPENQEDLFRVMIPSDRPNGTMAEGIQQDPKQAIEAYGLTCVNLITDDDGNIESGLDIIKAKKAIGLAHNPTHLCPFDNKCPVEIIEDLGDSKPCSVCPYAISGVNHLPAISAAKDTKYEEAEEEKAILLSMRKDTPEALDSIAAQEERCNNLSMQAIGWEYRETEISSKIKRIKQGFDEGEFTVGKPEFIANLLERTVMRKENDEAGYLIKRLRDCKAFPQMESKQIRAKFLMAQRRLLAAKDPQTLLDPNVSARPVADLYSLIHSYKDMHGISDQTIYNILNATPQDLIEMGPQLLLGEPEHV
ncbi:MAG: hypothetical protein ACRBB6_11950 [Neptuniibacter sp.]